MSISRLLSITLLGVIIAPVSTAQAGVITAWTFENNSIAVNNSPTASTGVGTATPLGMNIYPTPTVGVTTADVTAGVVGDTGTNNIADTSQIWRVRAQGVGSNKANGWSSLAPIGAQGAEFASSTAGYTGIAVKFDWYTTNQGEANLQFRYTTDGVNFTNIALTGAAGQGLNFLTNGVSPNTVTGSYINAGTAGQQWFTGVTATIADPAAANDANFAFELVNATTGTDNLSASGTALNNTSGNWRFDNVSISGNSVAVPEASSLILVGMAGVAGLGVCASRRRKAFTV